MGFFSKDAFSGFFRAKDESNFANRDKPKVDASTDNPPVPDHSYVAEHDTPTVDTIPEVPGSEEEAA